MFQTHRRELVVKFLRPRQDKRQPVPDAFWLSKGSEFPKPSRHGREITSTAASLPVRHVMARHWDVAAVLPLVMLRTSPPGAACQPRLVGFNKSRPNDMGAKTALRSEVA